MPWFVLCAWAVQRHLHFCARIHEVDNYRKCIMVYVCCESYLAKSELAIFLQKPCLLQHMSIALDRHVPCDIIASRLADTTTTPTKAMFMALYNCSVLVTENNNTTTYHKTATVHTSMRSYCVDKVLVSMSMDCYFCFIVMTDVLLMPADEGFARHLRL